ncbi:N-acetylmuramic acid 6-phosphate etherase [Mycobacterium sp. 21AC1]|uniref:tautomerase family protein n=1 Tax=[Mycobacterium] appelbergii TaxID=2939269 RepID=UPI0029390A44|nr:N-acetylmuramic acid 6-phosphate etherase [Mycobacterium sp. 21AC1]MDV3123467.1 N-acetylmuramic acid 6-phosphate etherase [Mycobacterium sp. 21AC1]
MPVFTIDAPTGVARDAKQKMMKEVTDALHEAWPIPDTRGWLREYPAENISQDGRIGVERVRPVCLLEAPELTKLDVKRKLVQKVEAAIATAYDGVANTDETLVLINHYPLSDVGWQGSLQSDRPEIVAAIAQINQ